MKISLITATWNAEESLPLMVQSLAEQRIDRSQLEWIVLDGGSSDDTLGVIERSGFKPDCLISESDEGLYDALNKGVRLATGDVVGFLHADDFLSDSSTHTNSNDRRPQNRGGNNQEKDLGPSHLTTAPDQGTNQTSCPSDTTAKLHPTNRDP